jgi:hypothetical protein
MHPGGGDHSVAGAGITSRENLAYNLRYGVRHITAQVRPRLPCGAGDAGELMRMRDDCDRHGAVLGALPWIPPISCILPGKGPERGRALDAIAETSGRPPKPA